MSSFDDQRSDLPYRHRPAIDHLGERQLWIELAELDDPERDQLKDLVAQRRWIPAQLALHDNFPNDFTPGSPEDIRYLAASLVAHAGRLLHLITRGWDAVPRRNDPEDVILSRRETSRARLAREVADVRMFIELLAKSINIDPDVAATIRLAELRTQWARVPNIAPAIIASEEAQRVE